jgi:hypothetical protein
MPASKQATHNKIGNGQVYFLWRRARPPETALLAIYHLLFAWNILNVRFI